jgi:pSer/pThr/pTyr-binding forkhead associated (FHA) protein
MPGAEATQMSVTITCPVCHSTTPGGEKYCSDCGFLLSSTPVEVTAQAGPVVTAKMVDPSTGREFPLNPGVNTIGRQDADVLVGHPTVSRKHAQLTVSDGKYILEDVGSSNGTYVGEKKVEPGQPVEVASGVEIRFGSAMMRLEVPEVSEAAAEEIVDLLKREEMAEESVEVEEVASELPPPVEAESAEERAAEESVEAEIPMVGVEADTDATPEQSLEEPIQPVGIHEEPPVLAKLVAKVGDEEFDIREGETTIGRRSSNDIAIADPYVSGSHAVITASEGSFTYTDVGSTNGSFIDGERLNPNEPRQISDGDEITIGQTVFRLTL